MAREAKLKAMQAKKPNAYLKPLGKPGTQPINKCLGVSRRTIEIPLELRSMLQAWRPRCG